MGQIRLFPRAVKRFFPDDTIATARGLRKDYKDMMTRFDFSLDKQVTELLIPQSVLGHALMGHATFLGNPYPNTTQDDIVIALGRDPQDEREQRQRLIDRFEDWILNPVTLQPPTYFNGDPLFGIDYFKPRKVRGEEYPVHFHMPSVRKGFVLGACMDDWSIRKQVNEIFRHANPKISDTDLMGGGEYHFVNLELVTYMHPLLTMAIEEHSDEQIQSLREWGIIVDEDYAESHPETVLPTYVRRKKGKGSSDDKAFVIAGILYGSIYPEAANDGNEAYAGYLGEDARAFDVAMGVFLADMIDTWDKYATTAWVKSGIPVVCHDGSELDLEGHDGRIAMDVIMNYPDSACLPEIREFVSHVTCESRYDPDCSARYFMQVDPGSGHTAFETHLDYIWPSHWQEMVIGFNRVLNTKFYDHVDKYVEKFLQRNAS